MISATAQSVLAAANDEAGLPGLHVAIVAGIGVLFLAMVVLFVMVLGSVLGSDLSFGMKAIWVVFVFWMPVIAWFAWYLIGRPDSHRRHPGTAH